MNLTWVLKKLLIMESGAFGDDGALNYLRADDDIEVDDSSRNIGRQKHKKMISGMHVGEIVRLIAAKFTI